MASETHLLSIQAGHPPQLTLNVSALSKFQQPIFTITASGAPKSMGMLLRAIALRLKVPGADLLAESPKDSATQGITMSSISEEGILGVNYEGLDDASHDWKLQRMASLACTGAHIHIFKDTVQKSDLERIETLSSVYFNLGSERKDSAPLLLLVVCTNQPIKIDGAPATVDEYMETCLPMPQLRKDFSVVFTYLIPEVDNEILSQTAAQEPTFSNIVDTIVDQIKAHHAVAMSRNTLPTGAELAHLLTLAWPRILEGGNTDQHSLLHALVIKRAQTQLQSHVAALQATAESLIATMKANRTQPVLSDVPAAVAGAVARERASFEADPRLNRYQASAPDLWSKLVQTFEGCMGPEAAKLTMMVENVRLRLLLEEHRRSAEEQWKRAEQEHRMATEQWKRAEQHRMATEEQRKCAEQQHRMGMEEHAAREEAEYRARHAASHAIVGYESHSWDYHGGRHNAFGMKIRSHRWTCGFCGAMQEGGGHPGGSCPTRPMYGFTMKPWEEFVRDGKK